MEVGNGVEDFLGGSIDVGGCVDRGHCLSFEFGCEVRSWQLCGLGMRGLAMGNYKHLISFQSEAVSLTRLPITMQSFLCYDGF